MTDDEFIAFVQKHRATIANILATTPVVYGDPSRFKYLARFTPNDLVVNTMSGTVTVEKDCFFGHGCMLLAGTHDPRKVGPARTTEIPISGRDIYLNEGVWVASGAIVLGPARIGRHSVVAAGAVVTGDVPAYTIVGGVPAKKLGTVPRPD